MDEPYYSSLNPDNDEEETKVEVFTTGLDHLEHMENGYVVLLERKEVSGKVHSVPLPWFITCCIMWWRRCCSQNKTTII
tara:strand:+ start:1092 stop:1328 length:237 start_codon:yes stop_codon:yes gene_type:complete